MVNDGLNPGAGVKIRGEDGAGFVFFFGKATFAWFAESELTWRGADSWQIKNIRYLFHRLSAIS